MKSIFFLTESNFKKFFERDREKEDDKKIDSSITVPKFYTVLTIWTCNIVKRIEIIYFV